MYDFPSPCTNLPSHVPIIYLSLQPIIQKQQLKQEKNDMMKRLFSLGMTIALAHTAWASTPEEYDFKGLNSEKTINRGESLGFTVNNGSNRTIYSFTIADIEMDLSRFGAFIGGETDGNFTLKTNGLLMKNRILSILNLKNGDKVTIEYKLASETASLTLADATLIGNTADVKTFESGTEYTITTEESSPVHLDIISSSNNNYITKVTVTAPEAESSVSTTVPVAKTGLIYNGEAQELVTAGVADGGTLKYFVSTSSTPPTISSEGWTTDVPKKQMREHIMFGIM